MTMYTAKIEAHDLNRIETEPSHLILFSLPSLRELITYVNTVMLNADRKKMLDGYSLTIHISKEQG